MLKRSHTDRLRQRRALNTGLGFHRLRKHLCLSSAQITTLRGLGHILRSNDPA
jgi:hypothetical protein